MAAITPSDPLTARNPDGTPAPPARAIVQARPGLIARAKLAEPVRLYGHGLLVLAAIALAPVLAVTSWSPLSTWAVAVLAAWALTVEAIRASVFPLASVVAITVASRGRFPIPTPESESA